METKKHYQHPSLIVVKLAGKDRFMQESPYPGGPVGVRGHRNDIDWEEE